MLAKVRSAVVNARVLAQVADRLGVGDELLLGRGEETSGGRAKASILADAFEAILGAIYLDAGFDAAEQLVLRELHDLIAAACLEPDDFDHKSRLQELAVRNGEGTPRYVVVGSGPDHDRAYVAEVFVAGTRRGGGAGRSKKDAEQDAARDAWEGLQNA
jgi:ribonuclease-3